MSHPRISPPPLGNVPKSTLKVVPRKKEAAQSFEKKQAEKESGRMPAIRASRNKISATKVAEAEDAATQFAEETVVAKRVAEKAYAQLVP